MPWIKDDSKEKIICAAIHYDDGKKYRSQPVNIDTGFVYGSRRHDAAMLVLHELGYTCKGEHVTQGFITTFNRFVDRLEAGRIAEAAHQWEGNGSLFSEDLY